VFEAEPANAQGHARFESVRVPAKSYPCFHRYCAYPYNPRYL
jgi:hypothetical protein